MKYWSSICKTHGKIFNKNAQEFILKICNKMRTCEKFGFICKKSYINVKNCEKLGFICKSNEKCKIVRARGLFAKLWANAKSKKFRCLVP